MRGAEVGAVREPPLPPAVPPHTPPEEGTTTILTVTLNPSIDKVYAVDDFRLNAVHRSKAMTVTAGGKGLNVARVAKLLGEEVAATGFLGGVNGNFLAQQIAGTGIGERFLRVAGESRICIAVMDAKNGTSTEVLEPGPEINAGEQEAFLDHFHGILAESEIVCASGSLPRGVPADYYRRLILLAKTGRRRMLLDASGEALRQGVEACPFMIKPNREELGQLLGRELPSLTEMAEALRHLRAQGIDLPVVTLGEAGCLAVIGSECYHFQAPPVRVVGTVGGGDAFIAGCAAGLRRGLDYEAAIRLAMACALANTQFLASGFVSPALVEKYLPAIWVSRIG